ncbi:hypothetical protein P885DRAFT_66995 [Corynascus similis CBS 632.67]
MTGEELKKLHDKFRKAGKLALYKTKLASVKNTRLAKLFLAVASDGGKIDTVNDQSIVIRLLQIPELAHRVLSFISPSIGDITALAMVCKHATACIRASHSIWDFTLGVFPIDSYTEKRDGQGRILQSGGVQSNTLIITPASHEPKKVERPYMADFENMMLLCAAITEVPSAFSSIVIDRLQFFDVAMFEMMINTMPNLKVVTITRCPMLDVTKLRPLLEVIKRHPFLLEDIKIRNPSDDPWTREPSQNPALPEAQTQSAHKSAKAYIRFDFFPFFFHGPQSGSRLGSYGVTHNEPTFNTPKAVFALILQCRNIADEVGMDLLSDSSSFWSFVRQLPGPDVLWAMKAREALITREREIVVGNKPRQIIEHQFADDLTAALTGDNQKHPVLPAAMKRYLPESVWPADKYWRQNAHCAMCRFTYPASLFPLQRDSCWSCKMTQFVENMEDSHLRLWQESALDYWRSGLDPKSVKLDQLLANNEESLASALREVQCADWTREYFLNFAPQPSNAVLTKISPPSNGPWHFWDKSTVDWAKNTVRKAHGEATEAFDYREGGPQRAHPCMFPLNASDARNPDYGAEEREHFNKRWVWTQSSDEVYIDEFFIYLREMRKKGGRLRLPNINEGDRQHPFVLKATKLARNDPGWCARVRRQERRLQNKQDKAVYMAQLAHVEGCLQSMSTLFRKPFNIDKPTPDPVLDQAVYKKLAEEKQLSIAHRRHCG